MELHCSELNPSGAPPELTQDTVFTSLHFPYPAFKILECIRGPGELRVRHVIKEPATSKPEDRKLEMGRLLSFAVVLKRSAGGMF